MITFKKTEGVQTSNHKTCIWIQEVILDFKRQTNSPIGKVVIDAEKKHSTNLESLWELQGIQPLVWCILMVI